MTLFLNVLWVYTREKTLFQLARGLTPSEPPASLPTSNSSRTCIISLSPKMSTLSPSASACSVQNTQVSPTPSTFHPCCIPPLYQTLTNTSHSPLRNHPGSLLKCTSPSTLTATGYLLITKSKDFHFFYLPRNVSSYLTLLDKALLINPHQVAMLALSCPKLRCPRLALTPLPAPVTI